MTLRIFISDVMGLQWVGANATLCIAQKLTSKDGWDWYERRKSRYVSLFQNSTFTTQSLVCSGWYWDSSWSIVLFCL